jgi:hypothetical protein
MGEVRRGQRSRRRPNATGRIASGRRVNGGVESPAIRRPTTAVWVRCRRFAEDDEARIELAAWDDASGRTATLALVRGTLAVRSFEVVGG